MSILKVTNLNKKFGNKEVLKDVSFEINEGDILAFIGPNGAGKTTTIKCILGLQRLTKGSITINGYDIKKNFVKAIEKTGCIVESPDVYMYLTGYENLKLQASLYANIKEDSLTNIIRLVGLENRIYDKVSKYSLGMKQKLGIAQVIMENPDILIFDEPFNGIEQVTVDKLTKYLLNEKKKGKLIIISTHIKEDLIKLSDEIYLFDNGLISKVKNV